LELKKTGNQVMAVIGGREIHPINVRVGGWYRVPRKSELAPLVPRLEQAREIALETVRFASALDFPDYEQEYELVSLSAPGEYPIDRGRIVSNNGLDIDISQYDQHFVEEHVPWSNALHSRLRERGSYLCGPLARFALSGDHLSSAARAAASEAGLSATERNPFRSIVVRGIEMVYATEEALRLIAEYEEPDTPTVEVEPRAGVGYGCTEAPRGILYHRYELDDDGTILDAKIVPPTSQNQRTIEEDLRGVVERSLDLSDDELSRRCEQTIRNYDPCISCATHFLTIEVQRS
jgi:coenzyme F420-reducing hydrogenase alpha subunit